MKGIIEKKRKNKTRIWDIMIGLENLARIDSNIILQNSLEVIQPYRTSMYNDNCLHLYAIAIS